MKSSREKLEEYEAGIDKALRRAAKRAALTAAATGTRLIIYDKDRIKRLRPLEVRDLPKAGKDFGPPRSRQKQVAVAENRGKYAREKRVRSQQSTNDGRNMEEPEKS